jgi:hypothetical protein
MAGHGYKFRIWLDGVRELAPVRVSSPKEALQDRRFLGYRIALLAQARP